MTYGKKFGMSLCRRNLRNAYENPESSRFYCVTFRGHRQ
jgi:hypothetical protein